MSQLVIAGAAIEIARETDAKHLIVGTEHGNAARLMALTDLESPSTQ